MGGWVGERIERVYRRGLARGSYVMGQRWFTSRSTSLGTMVSATTALRPGYVLSPSLGCVMR